MRSLVACVPGALGKCEVDGRAEHVITVIAECLDGNCQDDFQHRPFGVVSGEEYSSVALCWRPGVANIVVVNVESAANFALAIGRSSRITSDGEGTAIDVALRERGSRDPESNIPGY